MIIYRSLSPRKYVIDDNRKIIYIVNSKVACTTIKQSFIRKQIKYTYSIHQIISTKNNIPKNKNEYFKFSFVRNPFERLVSCYISKYVTDKKRGLVYLIFDLYLFGYMKKNNGFNIFINKISKIPDFLSDKHFKPQYNLLYKKIN